MTNSKPSEPDTGGCKIVTIISFVSGNPIHTERVTGPDLMKKVAKVLSDWGAYPYGQNGGEIRDC